MASTLPKNFVFHPPKTPEQPLQLPQSPSAPRQRVFRRAKLPFETTDDDAFDTTFLQQRDVAIPSIETQLSYDGAQPSLNMLPDTDRNFLCPLPQRSIFTTPPTTPVRQILDSDFGSTKTRRTWSPDATARPGSAFSDSSTSSFDTYASMPSFDGSTASPDSETTDPFTDRMASLSKGKGRALFADLDTAPAPASSVKQRRSEHWTEAMDAHLWSTYLVYLQDPTVTPFKVSRSGIPPLGICYRVAREARKSWKEVQQQSTSRPRNVGNLSQASSSQETLREPTPTSATSSSTLQDRSGSITPTAPLAPRKRIAWTKSESETRKRLRQLCSRKASQKPLRARLMSPGAVTAFTRKDDLYLPSSQQPAASFDTREMNVSLSTAAATTMQPDSMLANLGRSSSEQEGYSEDWFGKPISNTMGQQDIKPLDFGLGISTVDDRPPPLFRLRSNTHVSRRSHVEPYLSRKPSFSADVASEDHVRNEWAELSANMPQFSSLRLKRRAVSQLFDDPAIVSESSHLSEPAQPSHLRGRSRGFSMGASDDRPFSALASPPDTVVPPSDATFGSFQSAAFSSSDVPDSLKPRRLASPFMEPITNERLLSHMNEGSSSGAFSVATFPRPHRRKYPRLNLGDGSDGVPHSTATTGDIFGPPLHLATSLRDHGFGDEASRKRFKE